MFINHDPVMTLTYFTARSTWVTYAFELELLAKNGQIDKRFVSEKHFDPHRGLSVPALGLYTYI